ncbi:TRAP transporter substrate-binding protein [Neopusillimonas aestuarii]|uniref:TRAP transporter substrate-binding protein n=1 Tax=Neopusillimonas aestuarii TaxID=2716226 RepID=UPI001D1814F3|nr:TRAP transporter substrate-binding protein [Pusillimonas sp. DMV24BSW_D]
MRRRTFLKSSLAAAAIGSPVVSIFAQQAVTLKFHTFMPPQSDTWRLLCMPWMEQVTNESNGMIKFEGYPSMQLGGTPPQLYDQVRDGVVDVIWTLPGLSAGRFPRSEVFELPFIMNNPEATSMAFWEYGQTVAAQEYDETHLIALHTSGPGVFHSKNKPIHSAADLKGMKVRGPTRQTTKLLAAVGATPVGLPLPGIPDAISKGVIDAAVLPWQTVPSVKLDELCKYHTQFPKDSGALYTTPFLMTMNKQKYAGLPAELKAVMDANSGLATSGWCGDTTASTDPVGRKAAEDRGNEIYTFTDQQASEFIDIAGQVNSEWIADMSDKGFDGQKLYDTAVELIGKYGKQVG